MAVETNRQEVSLGCGTLIIIALIVVFFGGRGELRELREAVDALKVSVDQQSAQIKLLQEKVDRPPSSGEAAGGDQ